jgi:two-component system response regulator DesR
VGRGDEVVEAARASEATIALLDIEMPGIDGIAAASLLRTQVPGCRALIVTTFGRPGYLARAMQAGASRFVVKDTPTAGLTDAVRRVSLGFYVIDPVPAGESLAKRDSPLNERETNVLATAHARGSFADAAQRGHRSGGQQRIT